jgi:ribonuclease D
VRAPQGSFGALVVLSVVVRLVYTPYVINTDARLAARIEHLRAAAWVAVDTEADSLHAYPEKVCLVQLTIPGGDYLVDPLSGLDLRPLWLALADRELILHGADYDLRLLWKHHRFLPQAVFDTMVAARLVGHRQFSLHYLVAHYLGVTLDKGPQKADWARRPLTERMERYAHNDTRYLKPLADRLRAELEAKKRLAWHRESCAQLVAECARDVAPDANLVWRVKGSHALSRRALAVLRELWQWREREALAAARPPFFVLPHETLIHLALAATDSQAIASLVPRRFSDRRREGLRHAITRGLAVPPNQQPELLRPLSRRVPDAERGRLADLEHCRNVRAQQLGLDPALIASRATLLDLARSGDKHAPTLMRWQRELLQT